MLDKIKMLISLDEKLTSFLKKHKINKKSFRKWSKTKHTYSLTEGFDIRVTNYGLIITPLKSTMYITCFALYVLLIYLGALLLVLHSIAGLKFNFGLEFTSGLIGLLALYFTGTYFLYLGKNMWNEYERKKDVIKTYKLAIKSILTLLLYSILANWTGVNL